MHENLLNSHAEAAFSILESYLKMLSSRNNNVPLKYGVIHNLVNNQWDEKWDLTFNTLKQIGYTVELLHIFLIPMTFNWWSVSFKFSTCHTLPRIYYTRYRLVRLKTRFHFSSFSTIALARNKNQWELS